MTMKSRRLIPAKVYMAKTIQPRAGCLYEVKLGGAVFVALRTRTPASCMIGWVQRDGTYLTRVDEVRREIGEAVFAIEVEE